MEDLDSYRPSDFLMFSGRVYWRLIERYNDALWPAQILGLLIGLGIVLALIRPSRASHNAVYWGLALAWLGVALSFLRHGYAPINWTVDYLIPLVLAQAGLLAVASRHDVQPPATLTWAGRIGLTLILAALLLPPVIASISGRGVSATDWFPFFPDPLALATLGVLSAAGPGVRNHLILVIPIIWCLFNGATLLILDASLSGGMLFGAVLLSVIARTLSTRKAH